MAFKFNPFSGKLDIVETDHTKLSNIGTNTHAQIDTHVASTSNPHSTTDANLSTSDITTNNATTSKHGFVVKATAPSAGSLNVVGISNGETEYSNKTIREVLTGNRTYYVGYNLGTVTMTIASPCVVTKNSHGLENNDPIIFRTTGALPTGLTSGTTYYIVNKSTNTFEVSATLAGASINTSGTQSGTHSAQTGNNSNNGLTTGRAGAFLTIQKAVDVIATLDMSGFTITVQVDDGLYTTGVNLKNATGFSGPGSLIIKGNSSTPSNVYINTTSCFVADSIFVTWDIKDMKLSASSYCLAANNAPLRFGNIDFGTSTGSHIVAFNQGNIQCISNYAVSGNAVRHIWAETEGLIFTATFTVTFSNSPAFSTAFCYQFSLSSVQANGMTFTNGATVTGKRYDITLNSACYTGAGGANYFPGNVAGTTATGGQYS